MTRAYGLHPRLWLLAAINCTGSAEGALVPVLLRITHWTKSGLPVSPPGLSPPWYKDLSHTCTAIVLLIQPFVW